MLKRIRRELSWRHGGNGSRDIREMRGNKVVPPLEVCQLARGEEWMGCSVITAKAAASQGQGERDERERRGRSGKGGGECGRGRTTPGEGTLQESGGAHAQLSRAGGEGV